MECRFSSQAASGPSPPLTARLSPQNDPVGRVLYVSGSIGLGHAARDVAIARALRQIQPNLEIVFLAGDPARRLIADAGETVLPEAAEIGDESTIAEGSAEGFSLNLMSYGRRARRVFAKTIETFNRVSDKYPYDLLIGDETYEIWFAMAREPEMKRAPFTMIYDFVGYDAMSRNPIDHAMAYLGNWGWAGGRKQKPSPADVTLFVGEPEDVDERRFGLGLPNRRAFALRNYEFVGYVFPFHPGEYAKPGRGARFPGLRRPPAHCLLNRRDRGGRGSPALVRGELFPCRSTARSSADGAGLRPARRSRLP
jgi:hypothetical protein